MKTAFVVTGCLGASCFVGFAFRKYCCATNSSANPFEQDCREPYGNDSSGNVDDEAMHRVIKNVYSKKKIPENLDAIVIGSGIGALCCGSVLAKAGKRVLILEQHDQAGCCCHSFQLGDYHFDPGIHYVGTLPEGSYSRFLFDQLCGGRIQWQSLNNVYDVVLYGAAGYTYENCRQIPIRASASEYMSALQSCFPTEKDAIEAYVDYMTSCDKDMMCFLILKLLPKWVAKLVTLLPYFRRKYKRFFKNAKQSPYDVISRFSKNRELHSAICYNWLDVGTLPGRTSSVLQMALTQHYLNGASYPVGGSSTFAYHMIPNITRAGGAVMVQARVKQLLSDGDRVVGVEMAKDGTKIYAPMVISDAGVVNTIQKLLPEKLRPRMSHLNPYCAPGNSLLCIFVGLRCAPSELPFCLNRQYFYYHSHEYERDVADFERGGWQGAVKNGFPMMFISFPSAKDPVRQKQHPDLITCNVITFIPYQWFAHFKNSDGSKYQNAEYQEFKMALGHTLWEQTCTLFPELRSKVEILEVSTPLTMERFIASHEGVPYGINHDKARFSRDAIINLRPDTGIKGLYLTGQDVYCCGFMGAFTGGMLTACACLNRNLFTDIYNLGVKTGFK